MSKVDVERMQCDRVIETPRLAKRKSLGNVNYAIVSDSSLIINRRSLDARVLLTPINNSPLAKSGLLNSPHLRKSLANTNGFLNSPSRRRSLEPLEPRPAVSNDDPENDDEEERRRARNEETRRAREDSERKRQRESFGSPSNKSTPLVPPLGNMSTEQMNEHLARCIKLSTENKINMKNAFHLQLIDYMEMMVKKRDFDVSNFQMVGCTLDASTKIYSCRVDCVHTDVMKMAGAFGQDDRKKKKGSQDDEMELDGGAPEGEESQAPVKKKRVRRHRNVIVKENESEKLSGKEKLEPKADPYFQRLVTSVGEDSDPCHFIKTLKIGKDTSELLIFHETPFEFLPCNKVQQQRKPFTLPSLQDCEDVEICPTFAGFSFLTWSAEKEALEEECQSKLQDLEAPPASAPSDMVNNEFAFDMNAEVDDGHDAYDDVINNESDDDIRDITNSCGRINLNKSASLDLRKHLSAEPLEYSYFRSSIVDLWAGPAHWKIRPYSKGSTSTDGKVATTKKRQKKEIVTEFEDVFDIDLLARKFAICEGIKLQRKTIHQWGKDKTTHPPDPHIDLKTFFELEFRPKKVVSNANIQRSESVDDHLDTVYDYDNENDKENFCPDIPNDDDDDDDGIDGVEYTQDLPPPSQDIHAYDSQMPGAFTGDNLVAPPNKVARVYIPYALQPKRIDMKKLKTQLWNLMISTTPDKENVESVPVVEDDKVTEPKLFSEIYRDLPAKLSKNSAASLSAPLAFSALLHLTNEKSLRLEGLDAMKDIRISQN